MGAITSSFPPEWEALKDTDRAEHLPWLNLLSCLELQFQIGSLVWFWIWVPISWAPVSFPWSKQAEQMNEGHTALTFASPCVSNVCFWELRIDLKNFTKSSFFTCFLHHFYIRVIENTHLNYIYKDLLIIPLPCLTHSPPSYTPTPKELPLTVCCKFFRHYSLHLLCSIWLTLWRRTNGRMRYLLFPKVPSYKSISWRSFLCQYIEKTPSSFSLAAFYFILLIYYNLFI